MPVRYDLYETPSPDGKEKEELLHARIVNSGTVTTKILAEKISHGSTMTPGDIYGVLIELNHYIAEALIDGNRVHIDGLGYFQLIATSHPVNDKKEIRGNQVKLKAINFQPVKSFKGRIENEIQFLRINRPVPHSPKLTDEELEDLLDKYFQDHTYITRSSFQKLCGFTKSMAVTRIRKLAEDGKLKKAGTAKFPIYEPVKPENKGL